MVASPCQANKDNKKRTPSSTSKDPDVVSVLLSRTDEAEEETVSLINFVRIGRNVVINLFHICFFL